LKKMGEGLWHNDPDRRSATVAAIENAFSGLPDGSATSASYVLSMRQLLCAGKVPFSEAGRRCEEYASVLDGIDRTRMWVETQRKLILPHEDALLKHQSDQLEGFAATNPAELFRLGTSGRDADV
jgi:hypothetical protein